MRNIGYLLLRDVINNLIKSREALALVFTLNNFHQHAFVRFNKRQHLKLDFG